MNDFQLIEKKVKRLSEHDYNYIQELVKDVTDVIFDDFKVMSWAASVGVNVNHRNIYTGSSYSLEPAIDICYVLKYNFFARSVDINQVGIEYVTTKVSEETRFRELIMELMNELKDAGFLLYCHIDKHNGLSCGDTYIIEIWRDRDREEKR